MRSRERARALGGAEQRLTALMPRTLGSVFRQVLCDGSPAWAWLRMER